jgi:hypothetical protein
VRRSVVVLAALAFVAGTGCGGTSEEDEARNVVKEYADAIADGDERGVCATLSKESRKRFDRAKTTCEDAYKSFGKFLGGNQKDKLRALDPEVKVEGNKATTQIDQAPLAGELRLEKEGGEWKISTQ